MIFVAFALLTGVAVLAILAPLTLRGSGKAAADADIAFFGEQIAEIERERAEGRLTAEDAETAKAEAARRLLRAESTVSAGPAQSRKAALYAAIGAVIAIPAIAVPLYLKIGNVEMPDMPLQARLDARPKADDLAGAVARIEQHLREHPEDGRGYEVVAPYFLRAGRVADAIHAYSEALRLLGPSAARHASLAEARVVEARGQVTPEARKDFEAALALEPSAAIAQYYLALADMQAGEKDKAKARFEKMLADAPEGAAYIKIVKQQLAALNGEPAPAEEAPAQASDAAQAPNSAQGKAIQAMPADQQQQMIRTMVGRLADRLAKNGDDVEGWLKLIRAYSVLSDAEKAKQALADARKALAGKTDDVARVDALAKELNIGG